jgi:Asp-tRNA(Asn)/Glu-tRNA(Gln) amidotransferase C subunit
MLALVDTDLATLRHVARLAGFDFTDAELEALRPGLERALDQLRRLEALPLAALEPATQYRML